MPEHERWVEKRLAADLQKAGIEVLLDRWDQSQIGSSVARFVERIENADRIIVVGTPIYRAKFENKERTAGFVTMSEVDLIQNVLLGREEEKSMVLPILLSGSMEESFPPLLRGRVYADFRPAGAYFCTTFDLILSLFQLSTNDPAVSDLRESLRPEDAR